MFSKEIIDLALTMRIDADTWNGIGGPPPAEFFENVVKLCEAILAEDDAAVALRSEWHEFDSTNLKRGRHDPAPRRLSIEFNNGQVWVYHDVPFATWTGLLAAESAGKFFNAEIRDKFVGINVGAEDDEHGGSD